MPEPGAAGDIARALAFYALAGMAVVSAVLAVSLRNIFHAVLFLILSFAGAAGLFLTLNADFLAAVQVLVYAGAIAVLMLFALFLTRNAMTQGNPPNRLRFSALVTALLVFWVLAYGLLAARWAPGPASEPSFPPERLADALFNTYLLPFELASVLLLAAMIGAILLAKE